MAHRYPPPKELALQLIAAYERGETCSPATEEALREVLPLNQACPADCPSGAQKTGAVLRLPVAVALKDLKVAESG